MGYRGHDLDLRTPQTWRASPGDLAGPGKSPNGPSLNGPGRGGYASDQEIPIWVDDTVLACCNHAFDVALAHRSGEVRVEHLLHALTRIDDAADVLEANGIRVSSLRRETATVIASELPVSLSNGSGAPRRADAFEEVLRLAAAHAYQRNAPANVEDLLYVFLEMRPAIRGIDLVERHLAQSEPRMETRAQAPYRRPFVPPPPPQEPRYEPRPELRGYEVRYEPRERERVRRPAGRYFVSDPPMAPNVQHERVQEATDHLQNSRLDALEQMVRSISHQISSQRDDASRFSGGLFDRLQSLETMVSARGGPAGEGSELVLRRLEDVEQLLRRGEGGPIGDLDLDPVLDRLDRLERLVRETSPEVDVDLSTLERRLTDIESSLSGSIADLTKSVGQVEQKADVTDVMARLELIEEALLGRDGEMSGDLDQRVTRLGEMLTAQQGALEQARAGLGQEIRQIAVALGEQATRLARTGEGLGELVKAIEGLRDEERGTLSQVRQLLAGYQNQVNGFISKTAELSQSHENDLKEVHDALMKLNANQHTLAGSIDQWRSDSAGDLAIVAKRMGALEQEAGRPMALLETLSSNMENMHRLTVERYHRRNRFWYWLFGTDDWVAASWPSQADRIEAERRALRAARP